MVDEEESDGGMSYVYRRTEDVQRTPYVPYVSRDKPASAPARKPDPKDFDPELCGTPRGYRQHHRYRQDACRDCKDALNAQQRARVEQKKAEAMSARGEFSNAQ